MMEKTSMAVRPPRCGPGDVRMKSRKRTAMIDATITGPTPPRQAMTTLTTQKSSPCNPP
jgi:hypothetical protein